MALPGVYYRCVPLPCQFGEVPPLLRTEATAVHLLLPGFYNAVLLRRVPSLGQKITK